MFDAKTLIHNAMNFLYFANESLWIRKCVQFTYRKQYAVYSVKCPVHSMQSLSTIQSERCTCAVYNVFDMQCTCTICTVPAYNVWCTCTMGSVRAQCLVYTSNMCSVQFTVGSVQFTTVYRVQWKEYNEYCTDDMTINDFLRETLWKCI